MEYCKEFVVNLSEFYEILEKILENCEENLRKFSVNFRCSFLRPLGGNLTSSKNIL